MSDQFYQLSAKWTESDKYNSSQNFDYQKSIVDVCSFMICLFYEKTIDKKYIDV
ncbi:unnamed protein product [Paramecium octaurelia]|uniref:Uncharacterized protein n=1 Tax=Paramecium octaurelia TaxID=43137 RepID=A0A8S1WZR8_PAROT|nr:unnamed protein product [Paramecium octaurelia]